jgi:hypothetical protein
MSDPPEKTSPLALAAAWVVVAIPLSWGVYQTAVKALPLFNGPTAQVRDLPAPGTNPEKPASVRQRRAGKPTEDHVESILRSSRQRRREGA